MADTIPWFLWWWDLSPKFCANKATYDWKDGRPKQEYKQVSKPNILLKRSLSQISEFSKNSEISWTLNCINWECYELSAMLFKSQARTPWTSREISLKFASILTMICRLALFLLFEPYWLRVTCGFIWAKSRCQVFRVLWLVDTWQVLTATLAGQGSW